LKAAEMRKASQNELEIGEENQTNSKDYLVERQN
jgi:hypothetical protein